MRHQRSGLVVGLIMTLGLIGCDEFMGLGENVDANVVAEVNQENKTISYTIENTDTETIHYRQSWVEQRSGVLWRPVAFPDNLILRYISPIEEGEMLTLHVNYDFWKLEPGEYRLNVQIYTDDHRGDPENKKSNAVRIEQNRI